jgi:hypothetical protein
MLRLNHGLTVSEFALTARAAKNHLTTYMNYATYNKMYEHSQWYTVYTPWLTYVYVINCLIATNGHGHFLNAGNGLTGCRTVRHSGIFKNRLSKGREYYSGIVIFTVTKLFQSGIGISSSESVRYR